MTYPADVPPRAELTDVPFYPQEAYQCGPAALATAMTSAGVARTPQQLTDEVYLPQRKGTLQAEMLAATRRAGLMAYPLSPNLGAVIKEIAGGHPVVVLQNQLFDLLPRWHYAVVVGYDLPGGELILRSGTRERLIDTIASFDRSWEKSGRWAFLALAPGQLPATAEEDRFVLAAANLERVSPQAARAAYAAALAKWPHDLVARIALGNIAYGSHLLGEAETQYRLATEDHPDSADAWNNLAQVLHELGRDREALVAAQRAVAIGGSRQETYRATLQAIPVPVTR
ncbi:MAG TPA: PA2778 family cysteine peptidase [Burkholderiaceae bacterium]|nr:PA2778 family cysteine peptidase [Burkholderiaceae bacterium]